MSFTDEQKAKLAAPLDKSCVKTRKQAGTELSYIEGWWAIAEANRIFGFGNWDREIMSNTCVVAGEKDGDAVTYIATVRVTYHGDDGGRVVREGTGSGHGNLKKLGMAHESAIKEAETDAMKRALMTFGNPFGLALYDKDQANVAPTNVIKLFDQYMTALPTLASLDELKGWWTDAAPRIKQLPEGQRKELEALKDKCKTGLMEAGRMAVG